MTRVEPRVVVPLRRLEERRAAERFQMELPVTLDGGGGAVTRDISLSGLSFVSRQSYAVGERVDLTVDYLLDGHNYPLRCEATVVRCEPCTGGFMIAAKLSMAFLE